jgi:hypothetical protein
MNARTIIDSGDQRNTSDTLEVARFPKNHAEDVVVSLGRYNGHDLLDARVHALFPGATEKHPTRKGISIKVERLPDLIAALIAAEREARRLGLLADAAADPKPKDRTAAERQRRRRDRLRASRDDMRDSVTAADYTTPLLEDRHPNS